MKRTEFRQLDNKLTEFEQELARTKVAISRHAEEIEEENRNEELRRVNGLSCTVFTVCIVVLLVTVLVFAQCGSL